MSSVLPRVGRELLWLLVAIGVVAIIGVGYLSMTPLHRDQKAQRQQRENEEVERALELYRINHGQYPDSFQGLGALVGKPASGVSPTGFPPKGYLTRQSAFIDAWGYPIHYASPGQHTSSYDLASWGADGKPGGAGANSDITNWGAEDAT
jgi:general secretion pathway protein G